MRSESLVLNVIIWVFPTFSTSRDKYHAQGLFSFSQSSSIVLCTYMYRILYTCIFPNFLASPAWPLCSDLETFFFIHCCHFLDGRGSLRVPVAPPPVGPALPGPPPPESHRLRPWGEAVLHVGPLSDHLPRIRLIANSGKFVVAVAAPQHGCGVVAVSSAPPTAPPQQQAPSTAAPPFAPRAGSWQPAAATSAPSPSRGPTAAAAAASSSSSGRSTAATASASRQSTAAATAAATTTARTWRGRRNLAGYSASAGRLLGCEKNAAAVPLRILQLRRPIAQHWK